MPDAPAPPEPADQQPRPTTPGKPATPGTPTAPTPLPAPAPPGRPAPPPGWPAPPPGWPVTAPWPAPQWTPGPPSAFIRRWPGPTGAADRVVIGGALVTGVAAAASVPLDRPGAGWLLTGVVATACLAAGVRRTASAGNAPGTDSAPSPDPAPGTDSAPGTDRGRRVPHVGPARIAWGLATLALLGAGAVRAADWLFVLCVLTAAVTGSLALAGGRSLRGLVAGASAWPLAAVRSLPWAARGARALGGREARAGLSVLVTVVLLLVFGALFASADAAFDRMVSTVVPDLRADTLARWVFLFTVGVLALLGGAYLLSRPPDLSGLERPGSRRLRPFEWGLPVAALDLLFAAFVAVQFTVLFGGAEHVLGPDGPDFADYARGGFWQLLLVTMLTLAVLGGAARWARRDGRRDRVLVRVLLGILAALALVVVASALYRMHVYEQAYGFTRLRVLVSAFELWLGAVFALILGAGVTMRAGWLPRAVAGTAVVALLGLVALNPDRFIAERNVERYADSGRIDIGYLSGLSADAVPALDRLPRGLRSCALRGIAADLRRDPDDWRGANLARARARTLLADAPPGTLSGLEEKQLCGPTYR